MRARVSPFLFTAVTVAGQRFRSVPIDSVIPHPDNPRLGDVDAIATSIEANGFYGALIVQASTRFILAGNHRWRAAKQLGLAKVPAIVVDVTDEMARRILVVDNRSSDLASWDEPALVALLESLPTLEGTGFDLADLAALRPPEARTHADEAPPLPEGPTISAVGDLWRLGDHRLVVGDSREPAVFEQLLGKERVDLVWTDPPYGLEYVGKTAQHMTLEMDSSDPETMAACLRASLSCALDRCRPGAAWYVAAPDGPPRLAFDQVLAELGVWRQTLIWAKDTMVLSRQDFHYQHEVLFYGASEGEPPELPPEVDVLDPTLYEGASEPLVYGWAPGGSHRPPPDRRQTTVWYCPRPRANREHPTMKPVALIRRALDNSSSPGAIVLDCFAGSGSTMIACHHAGRLARLVELSPRYADVICRRWQMHTGIVPKRKGKRVDFAPDAAFADG